MIANSLKIDYAIFLLIRRPDLKVHYKIKNYKNGAQQV